MDDNRQPLETLTKAELSAEVKRLRARYSINVEPNHGSRTDFSEAYNVDRYHDPETELKELLEAVENMNAGFILYDGNDCFVRCNSQHKGYYPHLNEEYRPGVPRSLTLRRHAEYLAEITPGFDIEAYCANRAKFRGIPRPYEERRLPDGRWLSIREHLTASGGLVSVRTDITEQKDTEDQLRQSQRMEAVGQLTGGIAHDFNNLLGIMLGNTEMLEISIVEDEVARKQLGEIKRAVDRASSLTSRLLAFSRQQTLSPVPSSVSDLIESLMELLRRTLGETIDLKFVPDPELWSALIDSHQFENALVNLALNARDAISKGGEVTIEAANVTLDDAYAKQHEDVTPGDYIKIAVSDTGTGMSPDILAKAVEPFFTTKEVGEGSGLGLSMVFGFVKQSGGHIMIFSEEGHGSTIKLYLPRSLDDESQDETRDDMPEIIQGSERILVVEDDQNVRKVPVTILRDQGYEVVEAGDGKEAINHLKDGQSFDLLFTDVVLPGGMNGVDIADHAIKLQPNIKVLYTTGYVENSVVNNGKLDPGATLVSKPYRRVELLEKVRAALDNNDDLTT